MSNVVDGLTRRLSSAWTTAKEASEKEEDNMSFIGSLWKMGYQTQPERDAELRERVAQ